MLRRMLTRLLAIVPAVIVIALQGDKGSYDLLILSQVVLSIQLPFAVIPLLQFTNDRERMGVFANRKWVSMLGWLTAAVIVVLNARLVVQSLSDWLAGAGEWSLVLWLTVVPLVAGIFLFLLYIAVPKSWRRRKVAMPAEVETSELTPPRYATIGVALDLGALDTKVLSHARAMAQQNSARILLLHVVEGVGGQLFGRDAYDDEARDDRSHLEKHAQQLRDAGLDVSAVLGFGRVPKEIVRLSKENKIDLLVMGGHGHSGIKDLIFGTSVSKVRHGLKIPVMVVQ